MEFNTGVNNFVTIKNIVRIRHVYFTTNIDLAAKIITKNINTSQRILMPSKMPIYAEKICDIIAYSHKTDMLILCIKEKLIFKCWMLTISDLFGISSLFNESLKTTASGHTLCIDDMMQKDCLVWTQSVKHCRDSVVNYQLATPSY